MPNSDFRQNRVLELLRQHGQVRPSELAKEFGVSAMTIWRDLVQLEEQGLIERRHGVVKIRPTIGADCAYEARSVVNQGAKRLIARAAASHWIQSGDIVAMEGGTTVAEAIPFFPNKGISVVTNSLLIASRLRVERPAIPCCLVGGWIIAQSGNAVGPEALSALARNRPTICLLSASGWMPGLGPMDPNPLEIEAKRAMAAVSRRVILLLDSSKFGKSSTSIMIHPRKLHALVTESEPPADFYKDLLGMEVLIPGQKG